ncbi:hypothetical protein L484_004180 [Morus notabilis]|uniref:Uncharacterized protein n=1 Tax=Morus notabilis TaxID=981085 RepID=W9R3V4_9ROSA|nr:hypothetical protein L484_004180 [Morus notabilis]
MIEFMCKISRPAESTILVQVKLFQANINILETNQLRANRLKKPRQWGYNIQNLRSRIKLLKQLRSVINLLQNSKLSQQYNPSVIKGFLDQVKCARKGGVRFTLSGSSHFYVLITNVGLDDEVVAVKVKGSKTGLYITVNLGSNKLENGRNEKRIFKGGGT